ncbi:MAG: single-stranded DNA-binding protein [Planktothrix sp.]|jgi:single-strand DNA-binding protein
MSINCVILTGRVGQDPEIKYFESGKTICYLSLAVSKRKRDEKPDWVSLKLWDKVAEIAANYVTKGSLIGVRGTLEFEHWTDKVTGQERSKAVINVNDLELLGSKNQQSSSNSDSGSGGYYDPTPF